MFRIESDLSKVKKGDKIFTIPFGVLEVITVDLNDEFSIYGENVNGTHSFTKEGIYGFDGKLPLAFTIEKAKELFGSVKNGEYWAMVSEYPITESNKGFKRRVYKEKKGYFFAWDHAETDFDADIQMTTTLWRHAVPIIEEEVVKMTMNELNKHLGFKVEITE